MKGIKCIVCGDQFSSDHTGVIDWCDECHRRFLAVEGLLDEISKTCVFCDKLDGNVIKDPFINRWFHQGCKDDYHAERSVEGTCVYCQKEGTLEKTTWDEDYGEFWRCDACKESYKPKEIESAESFGKALTFRRVARRTTPRCTIVDYMSEPLNDDLDYVHLHTYHDKQVVGETALIIQDSEHAQESRGPVLFLNASKIRGLIKMLEMALADLDNKGD